MLKQLIQARTDVENTGEEATFEAVCPALFPIWGVGSANAVRGRLKDARISTKPVLWDSELASINSGEFIEPD
jgi:hypothetical protein